MTDEELLKIDICSRLPYGLKIRYTGSTYDCNIDPSKLNKGDVFDIWLALTKLARPILFPTSCLTEEIRFRGEKMVPMVELAKVDGRIDEVTNVFTNVNVLYTVTGISYSPVLSLVFTFDSDEISFSMEDEDDGYSYSVLDPLGLYDWLNSHMIDYRGLIDKGLAISVLDLKENPYG